MVIILVTAEFIVVVSIILASLGMSIYLYHRRKISKLKRMLSILFATNLNSQIYITDPQLKLIIKAKLVTISAILEYLKTGNQNVIQEIDKYLEEMYDEHKTKESETQALE